MSYKTNADAALKLTILVIFISFLLNVIQHSALGDFWNSDDPGIDGIGPMGMLLFLIVAAFGYHCCPTHYKSEEEIEQENEAKKESTPLINSTHNTNSSIFEKLHGFFKKIDSYIEKPLAVMLLSTACFAQVIMIIVDGYTLSQKSDSRVTNSTLGDLIINLSAIAIYFLLGLSGWLADKSDKKQISLNP